MADRPAAVVLATQHDDPTRFMFGAAEQVRDVLNDTFEVVSFLPYVPGETEVFVELFEKTTGLGDGQRRRFCFGFFSAHGSCDSLRGPTGLPAFEPESARLFTKSILVFIACMGAGEFPSRLVANDASVRAIIGYKRKFQVPLLEPSRKLVGDEGLAVFQNRMAEAVLTTVRTLLEPGRTVTDARNETLKIWGELARDKSFPREIQSIAGTNASRLTVWPEGSTDVLFSVSDEPPTAANGVLR